jgi:hypothetical protein
LRVLLLRKFFSPDLVDSKHVKEVGHTPSQGTLRYADTLETYTAVPFASIKSGENAIYGPPFSRVLLEPEIWVADAHGTKLESAAELCWYYGHGALASRDVFRSFILCRPLESVSISGS